MLPKKPIFNHNFIGMISDCGFNAHKRCSEKVPNDCCPDLKYVLKVFGIDLTLFVKAYNVVRPFIIEEIVKEIENRGKKSNFCKFNCFDQSIPHRLICLDILFIQDFTLKDCIVCLALWTM